MTKAKLMVAISGAVALAFSAGAAWDPGESVTTYWFGPGCPGTNKYALAMTDAWAKQLKEGGFNTVWASTPGELDIAAKYGLRAIYSVDPRTEWARIKLDDPEQKAKLAERINRVKNHPALYIYEHFDEAPADWFAELARVKEYIHELDPEHPCWFNLLPTYANHKQLGVGGKADEPQRMGFGNDRIAAYWEHVRLFCDVYQPEFITYDHYQLKKDGDSRNYFLNLGIIQQNAAARGVPFWNGLQACTWVPGSLASPRSPRIPNVDEMRYLAHTTAALVRVQQGQPHRHHSGTGRNGGGEVRGRQENQPRVYRVCQGAARLQPEGGVSRRHPRARHDSLLLAVALQDIARESIL